MPMWNSLAVLAAGCIVLASTSHAQDGKSAEDEPNEITVKAKRVANVRPAGTYASAATTLRFDPLTELQSRGLAEGQSDVTVRGGLFENTGFQLGAVTVMDPQTGHYVAELPVDPASMTTPAIYKGIDNALRGFNSAVATVSYGLQRIGDGGSVLLGAGSDSLNFQSLRLSRVTTTRPGVEVGAAVSVSRSEGDGSLPGGDHRFGRYNLHLQRNTDGAQGNLLVSYQDKFFGWPGAYTGFSSLPETDDTQTTLVIANHRRDTAGGWFEIGGFYRRLVDDYDFDRTTVESGVPGSFEHETRIFAVGFQGLHQSGNVNWRYGGQLTSDDLVRSTDLTNGLFTDRDYATLTIVPSVDFDLANERKVTVRAGATLDHSSRDSSDVLPLLGVELTTGSFDFGVEYAVTSQLPGYTALNSNPTGLFGGNPLLGREKAKQLVISISADTSNWRGRAALFQRRDEELVDWTYATGAPFARQANPVDLDVLGFEAFVSRRWSAIDVAAGYTWLDKDANYGNAQVDASFYALNFARHRATFAIVYRFSQQLELRLDNEYRVQEDNPLRASSDNTYLGSLALGWQAQGGDGLAVALTVDNVSDSDYQPFPGTPAAGRQFSLSASYTW